MGLSDFNAKDQVYHFDPNDEDQKSKFSEELIGEGVAIVAMEAFQNYCAENGAPDDLASAKDLVTRIAFGEVDKLFNTKDLDAWDRDEAKRQAKQQAEQALSEAGQY